MGFKPLTHKGFLEATYGCAASEEENFPIEGSIRWSYFSILESLATALEKLRAGGYCGLENGKEGGISSWSSPRTASWYLGTQLCY